MNVYNQYVVGILVCLRLIALPVYADEAPDSTTGATLHSKIKMTVAKQTCGWYMSARTGVTFGIVSPKEIQKGGNKQEFYFIANCEENQGFINVEIEPTLGVMGSGEDGYMATVRSDVALQITWRSTSFESEIQTDSPVKFNTVYYFDKLTRGGNEIRFKAQLVSWPLNTLIPLIDPITHERHITNTSLTMHVSYI